MEQIKLALSAAKDSIDEFKREQSYAGEEMKEGETLTSSLKIVDRAWKQCIKYGLMCFLRRPDASADTEQCEAVRQSLKDAWGKHGKCDETKANLGDLLVTEIENILKMIQPKTAATASRSASAQCPVVKRQKK